MKFKDLKEKSQAFDQTEAGKNLNKRLKRIFLNGCICVILSIVYLIWNIVSKAFWYEYLLVVALVVFGIAFIYKSYEIKFFEVNRYNYNNRKRSKK